MAAKEDPHFDLKKWEQRVDQWSKQGKRVIAVGYQPVKGENLMEVEHDHLYQGIHLLGLAALQDAPREEVIVALKQMNQAGVSVKMITGDDPQTARAIGKQLGLTNGPIHAITGAEWDALNEKDRGDVAMNTQVFARTTPQNN